MKHLLRNRIKAAAVATCLLGAGALALPAQAAGDDQMSGIHAGDVLVRLRAISIMPNVGTVTSRPNLGFASRAMWREMTRGVAH
ncbi:hypothetical protein R69658_08076 [Paraburkholderia aspalathi]|uniref:Uncharacterized protein n=1 Tax=Paraburkholderia aspalathi TaxID=1324617 RepID=A0ABM8T8Q2_9BURK|nr:hypothetical protein R69658_08076 [Paraburkholderia aspalathi]